ncbi:hypothetical protein HY412_01335 [Candidatus Kaiserbacteria bacterium]|nr:hypothetical protein [Candidatus Kaiserbacteria bacterium]
MTLPTKSIFRLPASDLNPTLKALNDQGVTLDHIGMLRANNGNNDYARFVGRAFTQTAFPSSTDTRIARILLNKSFVDVCDWVTLYGAIFTRQQMRVALKFPWNEDVLQSPDPWEPKKLVKDTHTAFLGLEKIGNDPLTVSKWIELHPATGQPRFYFSENPWHVGQPHTDVATLSPRWYLLRNEIVPGSTGKSPDDQVKLLPAEYELPNTIAEVSKDILIFRKTDIRLNPSLWARCSETTVKTEKVSGGVWSMVGYFSENGLDVNDWYGGRSDDVGCGAARKV